MNLAQAAGSLRRVFWILAAALLGASIMSWFFTGTHMLPGHLKLRIDGFEKPLVMAVLLSGVAWHLTWMLPRLVERKDPAFGRRAVLLLSGLFIVWFFVWNALRCQALTIGYDMGTYSNILFNTSQGRWFLESHGRFNMLAEHFMVASAIFAPLVGLWRDPMALVLAQCLAVSFSLLAIHELTWVRTRNAVLSFSFVMLFLVSPFTHRIMMDPYRPITLAIPLFLWALVALEQRRRFWFWVLVLISWTVQENTPIFLIGLGTYLLLFRKGERLTGMVLVVLSFATLAFVMEVAMPYFYGGKRLEHMDIFWKGYEGSSFGAILVNIVKNPWPLAAQILAPGKIFQVLFLTSTVLFLCFRQFRYVALFILPILFYQMTDFSYMNNFSRHYSSEPMVGIFYGAILAVSENGPSLGRWFASILGSLWGRVALVLLLLALVSQIPDYRVGEDKVLVQEARAFMREIPVGASVSCSRQEFYAPMAFREAVMAFPVVRVADFVLIAKKDASAYPDKVRELQQDARYERIRDGEKVLLFRRKVDPKP